jgi:D-cysteine desulfhydrase
MNESRLSLFQRYPALQPALPRAELTKLPTPAHRLENLERVLRAGELWIKRDDQCGIEYGGNKPRKLEFLLGQAIARGANTVITFGTLGTHHGLATTICAGKLGLNTVLVLVDEPVREETRKNLLLCHAHGARLCYAGTRSKATLQGGMYWLRRCNLLRWKLPYLIMPGGSSPPGAIGYVNAALELEDQVRAGELPEPDYIFVAVGTNGTMAGLEAGLRLTGLQSKVIGVCVSDQVKIHARVVAGLANHALSGLCRHVPEIADAGPVRAEEVTIWYDYLGPGYAHPTPEAERAVQLMAEREGIQLEFVYTGKTLAALMDGVGRPDFRDKRILFWNTYNSTPLSVPEGLDHRQLPSAFHRFFQ